MNGHLLFGLHIQNLLEIWETIGGLDEQSIQGTHPKFLFSRASFVVNLIDEMLEETSTMKRPDTVKRGQSKKDEMVIVEGGE